MLTCDSLKLIASTGVALSCCGRMHTCGVDTITAPASGRRCPMLIWASPVPGGMSTTSTSRAPHSTPRTNLSSALITIGPRHTAATSSYAGCADKVKDDVTNSAAQGWHALAWHTCMRKPIDMQRTR